MSERTNDLIKDLIPEGALDGDTLIVLVNAIYMMADWSKAFNPEFTKYDQFSVADKLAKSVSSLEK